MAEDISDTVSTRLNRIYPGEELYTFPMFLLMSISTQKDIEHCLNVFTPTNKSVNNFSGKLHSEVFQVVEIPPE